MHIRVLDFSCVVREIRYTNKYIVCDAAIGGQM